MDRFSRNLQTAGYVGKIVYWIELDFGTDRPFLEDKQSLRCCNLLRGPDKVTGRKNRSEARGASSSVRRQGLGRRHGSRLEPGDRKRLEALTWRKTGPRRTKAYDVTCMIKVNSDLVQSNNSLLNSQ